MGIFGTKKEEKTEEKSEKSAEAAVATKDLAPKAEPKNARVATVTDRNLADVLVRPHVSEKAYLATEKNVYVFEVQMSATKHDVRDAIRAKYNVTPKRVNIVKNDPRSFFSRQRGRAQKVKGLKKAYVYLKEGDKIDLV